MVNVTKMLELIRQNPGIRTVQLSDKLDCDIEHLNDVLQGYVDRGELTKEEVIAPNQRRAMAYWIAGAAPASQAQALPVVPAKPKTNVEKAIEFITANGGQVTAAQLHGALGLKQDEYPSQYLNSALKSGRLVKDGKFWRIGTVPDAGPVIAKNDVPVSEKAPEIPEFATLTVEKKEVAADQKPAFVDVTRDVIAGVRAQIKREKVAEPDSFLVALLSNSNLEIRLDGQTITLTKDRWAHMREFINKVELA